MNTIMLAIIQFIALVSCKNSNQLSTTHDIPYSNYNVTEHTCSMYYYLTDTTYIINIITYTLTETICPIYDYLTELLQYKTYYNNEQENITKFEETYAYYDHILYFLLF